MTYSNPNIKARHEAAIKQIKAQNGLIDDLHRPNGKIQISHVGVFQQNPNAKNPLLVALLDGVMFCINHIDLTQERPALSRESVGGTMEAISLPMIERCQRYNDEACTIGKFIQIVHVKIDAAKAA